MRPLTRRLAPLLFLVAGVAAAQTQRAPGTAESLVSAAEQAIELGDDRQAESLLSRIPAGSLSPAQMARIQIVRAEIGVKRRSPEIVLRALPPSSERVPLFAPRIEQLRSRALFATGDPVGAVRSLVLREKYLNTPGAVAENQDLIWNGLILTPIPRSAMALVPAQDAVARGWIDLGLVLQQGPNDAALAAWQQRNPGHPGSTKLSLIRAGSTPAIAAAGPVAAQAGPALSGPPPDLTAAQAPAVGAGGYALLLPLGGALAAGASAVREGFISAWFELPEPRPPVRIYDSGTDAAATGSALDTALQDGAEFIIGPLTKEGVSALAARSRGERPWLALNYLDAALAGGLQFGLAPEDEARAAAIDAAASGRLKALVLAPDNDWGTRVQSAYAAGLSAAGGEVLQSVRYPPGLQDFGTPLKDLMQLDLSNQRHRAIDTALGANTEFDPRPRGDAEVLFAPARTTEIQVLVPQLEFFRARRLPAYAIAAAYSGQQSAALEGLRLCDMPWMLAVEGSSWATARELALARFPEVMRNQPRLFAFGADALRIAQAMQRGGLDGTQVIDGATGRLRLEPGGRITRELSCATFREGRPVP